MKLAAILPIVLILFVSSAYAKCEVGSNTLFSCMTQKGKQIEVCDSGKTVQYFFGKPQEKPEIMVTVPRNQASTSQWNGLGRYMSYSVDISNKNAVYSVFWGVDRITEEHPIEAGVHVWISNDLAATVKCSGENITNNLEGVDLKPTE